MKYLRWVLMLIAVLGFAAIGTAPMIGCLVVVVHSLRK